MIFHQKPGSSSCKDLRAIGIIGYPIFHETRKERGLLKRRMNERQIYGSDLFIYILSSAARDILRHHIILGTKLSSAVL